MIEILAIIAVTFGAFVATNLDNLILLTALYSRYEQRPAPVAAGFFAGMLLIGSVSLAISKTTDLIPVEYLGLLGVIPVLIGITALTKMFRGLAAESGSIERRVNGSTAVFAATLMTQLSNGADTVVTFSILFADTADSADYWIGLAFFLMLCLFASTAFYLLRHQWLAGVLKSYGHFVTPLILISVGLYVLSNTMTDVMPG